MPVEANRLRRLGRRDRRFLAALAGAAVLGTTTAAAVAGHREHTVTRSDCIILDQAGVMGGGTWHVCGGDAVAFCRRHAAEDTRLAARCDVAIASAGARRGR